MADITKCAGENCPYKDVCYRYLANDSAWQSYSDFYKDLKPNEPCVHFWPFKPG